MNGLSARIPSELLLNSIHYPKRMNNATSLAIDDLVITVASLFVIDDVVITRSLPHPLSRYYGCFGFFSIRFRRIYFPVLISLFSFVIFSSASAQAKREI